MKIAIIFHRLGPYHFARLRAAGLRLPVVALETSGADATYAWDKIAGADGFERVTLFADADAQTQPAKEVARRLTAALDQIQPKLVVVPGWADPAALAALQWCSQNQVPSVVMSESTEWDEVRSSFREALKRRIVGLCSAALVGGTPHRDYLVKLGMPAERIFLGYDAVDNRYFEEKAKILKTETLKSDRSNLGMSACQHVSMSVFKNAPFFLASARFIEKKNLPRLIQAYACYRELASKSEIGNQKPESKRQKRHLTPALSPVEAERERKTETLKSQEPRCHSTETPTSDLRPPASDLWSLVILGDGPLRSDLCCQISDLRLQHSVVLPGFIQYPELPAYYARAGAFIHASTTEQWGLVVNEAMASGLPVLVSNRCGCAMDLVQEGVNGFTFDPYDVEQLAQLMLKISAMPPSSPPRTMDSLLRTGWGEGGRRSDEVPRPDYRPAREGEVSFPSDNLSAFQDFSLSAFGAASRRIIADWGPERFATGLKDAVDKSLRTGPVKATLGQRLILKILLAR